MKDINIGIMGMGTVGSGVYRVIEKEGAYIQHKEDVQIHVKKVLALDYSIEIPEEKKTSSIEDIVTDPDISIVVEVMGGIEPAKRCV